MVRIGIDPSLNSTGVCVNDNGVYTYYIIASHMTAKMRKFTHKRIHYAPFEKCDTNKKTQTYACVERAKALNINNICNRIEEIVNRHNADNVVMEGISYGSAGSSALADLAGLNFSIRNTLIHNNISFTIATPGSIKKFATGNGSADKALMIHSWRKCEPELADVDGIKVDDIADAYFMSCYDENI